MGSDYSSRVSSVLHCAEAALLQRWPIRAGKKKAGTRSRMPAAVKLQEFQLRCNLPNDALVISPAIGCCAI